MNGQKYNTKNGRMSDIPKGYRDAFAALPNDMRDIAYALSTVRNLGEKNATEAFIALCEYVLAVGEVATDDDLRRVYKPGMSARELATLTVSSHQRAAAFVARVVL